MNSQPLNLVQVCEDVAYWCWRPGDRGRDLASFGNPSRGIADRHRKPLPSTRKDSRPPCSA